MPDELAPTEPRSPTSRPPSLASRPSPGAATRAVKLEPMELPAPLDDAQEEARPVEAPVDAGNFINETVQPATADSQATLDVEKSDVNAQERGTAVHQAVQTAAGASEQGSLLPQNNNTASSSSRSLRPPARRRASIKSIEGAAQDSKQTRTVSSPPWSQSENEALWTAVDLIPHLRYCPVKFGSETVWRPQLLAEYIRRQTGSIKTVKQVGDRMTELRTPGTTERLRGATVSNQEAQEIDWRIRLGRDHFPQTKPTSLLDAYGTTKGPRKQLDAPAVSVTSADSHRGKKPRLSPPTGTSTPASALPASSSADANDRASALNQEMPIGGGDSVDVISAAKAPSPDNSLKLCAPRDDAQQPKHRSRVKKPKSRPFLIDLSAILSSLVPGHDLTTAAHALFACGITSTFYLADLLVLDKDVANVFLDIVGKRTELSAFEVAWTKKALDTARKRVGAMV